MVRLLLLSLAACLACAASSQEPARRSSLTGDVRKHEGFESKILGNRRNLTVYVPPGYDLDKGRRYPVLYMHDGQNLFDGMTSFIPNMEWRVDETAEALIRAKLIEPILVVGIDNAGMQRADEFLPTRAQPDPSREAFGGRADLYARMLLEEIKPLIDRTYRTKPGREHTAVGGSSFGGVLSLHLGLTQSRTFSKLAVVSPSVWWDDRVMVRRVEELARKPATKIWLDMGTAEGAGAVRDVGLLHAALRSKGWRDGEDLAYYLDAGAAHNEAAWSSRVAPMLMFMFAPPSK